MEQITIHAGDNGLVDWPTVEEYLRAGYAVAIPCPPGVHTGKLRNRARTALLYRLGPGSIKTNLCHKDQGLNYQDDGSFDGVVVRLSSPATQPTGSTPDHRLSPNDTRI